jgi:hypothetical protein
MKDTESMFIAGALAIAAYFLLFRRAGAITLNQGGMYAPNAARIVSMVPTPANIVGNNLPTLAEKVATYGNTGAALGDWSYE